MSKQAREEFKTWGAVFDEFTLRTLFELITKGHFERMASPLSVGKESNVFTGIRRDGTVIVVKIYRLETCDFNRMYDYIKFDPRFIGLKKRKRLIIFAWVQREYRNLMKAREAGVNVPKPLAIKNNVLLEEFIGDELNAPKLKDQLPKNKKAFFEKIIKNMQKLYKAGLVHADLSQFNILNYKEEPVLIDFSQCTTLENPRAEEFLQRDVRNVCNFFRKIGLNVEDEKTIQKIRGI